ncbi:MAG: ComEC/Rec2 family competence protein [Oscillospiraceae bacterium]
MKRKMVYIGLPVLLGLLFASFLSNAYDYCIVLATAVLFVFLKYPVNMKNIEAAVCITAFAAGFFIYRTSDSMIYQKTLDYSGQTVEFSGMITDFSDYSGDMTSYTLKGKINGEKSAKILYYGNAEDCRYGDRLELICTLDMIENSYGFDSVNYYKSKGIFLRTVSVEKADFISTDGFEFIRSVFAYRERIHRKIMSVMHYEEGNILSSMLFGSSYADMDSNTKAALYRIGTGHVFAVSGFHLMLMASLMSFLLKKFHTGHILTFITVSVSSLIFIVCSGFSLSAIRAGIIIVISYSAAVFSRMDDALNSLSIAILIMTLSNPFIVGSPSFMLSVSGFYGIAVFAPYMTANMPEDKFFQKLWKDFVSLICMSVIIIPVSSMFFSETSLISAITGIIMMPVISFVLMLGMIVFITGGVGFIAYPLLKIADVLCRLIKDIAEYSADMRFITVPLGYDFMKYILIVVLAFVCITYAVFKSRESAGISMLISVIVVVSGNMFYKHISQDILNVTVFGKDSSELVIVTAGNSTDVIDISGGKKNSAYTSDYMKKYGLYSINSIVVSEKPYRFTAYNDRLEWYDVKSFCLPENTYFLENSTVCGCTPQYYSDGSLYIEYNDYCIIYRNSEVYIKYNDYLIDCNSDGVFVYSGQDKILESPVDKYITLKTDGFARAEFVR